MKKLLVSLFAVALLAGCGSSGGGAEESKTCSFSQSGMDMAATFTAKDDKIKSTSIKVSMPASMLGGVDLSAITDEEKKQVEEQVLTSYGFKEGEGLTLKTNFTKEAIEVDINVDLEKSSADALASLGFTDIKDASLKGTVKDAEASGATCK